MEMFEELSIIVPYRECTAERAANYRWTVGFLETAFPGAEIIVADDGQAGENFSAARSRNAGARRATRDSLLFTDADIFYPAAAVADGLAALRAGAAWVAPYHGYRMIGREATEQLLREPYSEGFEPPAEWITESTDDYSVGGVTLIPRITFRAIGGYDDRITAWGREDWIFRIAADALAGPLVRTGGNIYHLHHRNTRGLAVKAGMFQAASELWKRYNDAGGQSLDERGHFRTGSGDGDSPRQIRRIINEQRGAAPEFSLLMPYSRGDAARDRFIHWLLDYYSHHLPEAEIILAGDGHAAGELPNRSRMRNNCARQATTDLFLFLDADCLVKPAEARAAVERARAGTALTMWRGVDYLTAEETARITSGPADEVPEIRITGVGKRIELCKGFNFALTRGTFAAAGGFDERFVGYAYEDIAFTAAVETLAGECERLPHDAAHLYHPEDPCRVGERASGQLARNEERLKEFQGAMGDAERMRGLVGQARSPRSQEGQAGSPRALRILVHAGSYLPVVNAGAEWALHGLLCGLRERGHEVTVYAPDFAREGEYDGVRVVCTPRNVLGLYREHDIVIGQLDGTSRAVDMARRADIPLALYAHNPRALNYAGVDRRNLLLLLICAEWLRGQYPTVKHIQTVNPPIDAERYRVERPGRRVTLINLNRSKGGELFWRLAARMPDIEFLGARGGYGRQVMVKPLPANVRVLENSPDMRQVYAETGILIAPSFGGESWGRCGLEAAASGIPTIAYPTAGLRESLGEAGIFVESEEPAAWEAAIRALREPETYAAASAAARARFAEFTEMSGRQLAEVEEALYQARERFTMAEHASEKFEVTRNILYRGRMIRRGSVIWDYELPVEQRRKLLGNGGLKKAEAPAAEDSAAPAPTAIAERVKEAGEDITLADSEVRAPSEEVRAPRPEYGLLPRRELNALAESLGIENAARFPNKAALVARLESLLE